MSSYYLGQAVRILRGRYAGMGASIAHLADPHPLSPDRPRWALRTWGTVEHPPRTLLMQEEGFRAAT